MKRAVGRDRTNTRGAGCLVFRRALVHPRPYPGQGRWKRRDREAVERPLVVLYYNSLIWKLPFASSVTVGEVDCQQKRVHTGGASWLTR
jgi:hypothetical protein